MKGAARAVTLVRPQLPFVLFFDSLRGYRLMQRVSSPVPLLLVPLGLP